MRSYIKKSRRHNIYLRCSSPGVFDRTKTADSIQTRCNDEHYDGKQVAFRRVVSISRPLGKRLIASTLPDVLLRLSWRHIMENTRPNPAAAGVSCSCFAHELRWKQIGSAPYLPSFCRLKDMRGSILIVHLLWLGCKPHSKEEAVSFPVSILIWKNLWEPYYIPY